MRNEWILDVLADLQTFAHENGMSVLAEQLDYTRLVAATELALTGEGHSANERNPARAAGNVIGGLGTCL
ncbi:hypothetical protein ROG8370_02182 [Roseovarius gaetbuli]|uniref:Uncharacterized protein n=1 Tax=Roseovarius gaetbuli TaxID=1356575 RepID=A0A1X6ZF99_9RHOB|nr:hypothetical protein ROG8370_02182 [Roseovarius gaetbuli]